MEQVMYATASLLGVFALGVAGVAACRLLLRRREDRETVRRLRDFGSF